MNRKKYTAMALILALTISLLAGCGAAETEVKTAAEEIPEEETAGTEGTETEPGLSAARLQAENTMAELLLLKDDAEALEERFDELMASDSDDPGKISFPDGYVFTAGTMYDVFEDAAFALEEYGLSDIVESGSGYHIILRLPLETEYLTMDQDANTGAYFTLRETAANSMFSEKVLSWMADSEIVWEDGFEELSLNELFGIHPLEEAAEEAEGEEEGYSKALEEAYGVYPADKEILSIDGLKVEWSQYYYLLLESMSEYFMYYNALPKDFAELITTDMSLEDYFKTMTFSKVKYYAAAHNKALEKGLTLSEEEEASVTEYWDEMVSAYGSEEALEEEMKAAFLSKETFLYFVRCNTEMSILNREEYGALGEKLSDEDVLAWGKENGYIRTKHILYMPETETEESSTELTGSEAESKDTP